jgi:hypothetical protein
VLWRFWEKPWLDGRLPWKPAPPEPSAPAPAT